MSARSSSTISLKKETKSKLNQARAPGQCFDGFLCQLIDMWVELHPNSKKIGTNDITQRRYFIDDTIDNF